jgi:hypothetical protein
MTATGGRLDVGNLLAGTYTKPTDIAGDLSTTSVLGVTGPCQSVIDFAGDQDWFKVSLTKG